MNKDEIIEEMAKILCDKDKRCEECISRLLLPCGYKSYCTRLYNANYRKVGEDEIVESMKTYERAREETAREILQELYYEATSNVSEIVELTTFQIEQLANRYGIELEENL